MHPRIPFAFFILLSVAVALLFLLIATAVQNRRYSSQTRLRLCRGCGQTHPNYAVFCRRCGRHL